MKELVLFLVCVGQSIWNTERGRRMALKQSQAVCRSFTLYSEEQDYDKLWHSN